MDTVQSEERYALLRRLCQDLPEGELVELGVKTGTTMSILAAASGRVITGFDAWQAGAPVGEEDNYRPMHSWYPFKPELIWEKGRRQGLEFPERTMTFVRGFVEETIDPWIAEVPRPLALIHIDVDTYSGYNEAFKLWGLLVPGGIVVMDEYNQQDVWPGARQATDEFLNGRTDYEWHDEDVRCWIRKL